MVTGEPGAFGPHVQRPAGSASSQEAEHALIQSLKMAAVPVQGPLLNRHLVIPHHAKVMQLTVILLSVSRGQLLCTLRVKKIIQ